MDHDGLAALEPRIVWGLFAEITRIPRCTGKEDRIRAWVKQWVADRGLCWEEDGAGNLLLRREASPGRENTSALVLQAHLDMVCAKAAGNPTDFDTDPIQAYAADGWVRARGTTLGADNGIGIAYALAALGDPTLEHGPLEALLTVDEEGGMKGAFGLKGGFFSGEYLLNLDSEELGVVTIGTAGGQYTDYSLPLGQEPADRGPGPAWKAIEITVEGLAGGHSGIEIHLPRLNAIRVVLAGLECLRGAAPLRVAAFEGGTASNVIPPRSRCVALTPESALPETLERLAAWREGTLEEFRAHEPGLEIAVRTLEAAPGAAYSVQATEAICGLLGEIPHGPLAYSRDIPGLVETSNNLSRIESKEASFEVFTNARGSVDSTLRELTGHLREIGERYGAAVKQHTRYPGWTADPGSPFNGFVKRQYESVLGGPVELKAFHAGLECGVFKGVAPELEMVSLGPTLRDVHGPAEAVDVASVATVWQVIRRIIENMHRLAGRS